MGVKRCNGGSILTCECPLSHRRVRWGRLAEAGMEPESVLLARSLGDEMRHIGRTHEIHDEGETNLLKCINDNKENANCSL